ncbi:MAG: VanW family protein [Lachnospiraceae bacterium]|nr:VanW family protein [Lachnospiraceae bacterium]
MKGKRYMICGAVGVTLLGTAALSANQIFAGEEKDKILSGIYIEDVYVGGDTKEEAIEKLDSMLAQKGSEQVTLNINQQSYEFSLSELGVNFSYEDIVDKAFRYGKTGNLIKRFKEQEDAKNNEMHLYFDYDLDEAVFEEVFQVNGQTWFQAAQNASIYKDETGIQIVEEVVGTTCDMEATKEAFGTFLKENYKYGDTTFDVVVIESTPDITAEELEQIEFTVLGSFTTNYGSSSWNRKKNVQNATDFINGTVLMPGEEFNTSRTIMPFTKANGYYDAGSYLNGEVVQSLGGGVCQVSTTLYNAVLLSELEVVQRYPHSMTVAYVQLAADAAISGEAKNFIFKNNLDTPIYIEGTYTNSKLTFQIYGKETRPSNRTIEFKNQVLSVIQPPAEIVTIDPAQPVGYRKVTQAAHTGYKVNLVKYIYEDGTLVGTEVVNTSSYGAQAARVTEGGAEPVVSPEVTTPEGTVSPETPIESEAAETPAA